MRMRDTTLFANYLRWAERFSVFPLPEKTLQTLLGQRKPQVEKERERCKRIPAACCDWRAARQSETPFYTINPPRLEPALTRQGAGR